MTKDILNDYEKNGFIILKNFISEDKVHAFQNGLESLLQLHCKRNNVKTNDYFSDGYIQLRNKDSKITQNIYNTIRHSNIISSITSDLQLINYVKLLLNMKEENIVYTMYNICRMDMPNDQKFLLRYHQEAFSTIPFTNSLQLWAPIIERNCTNNGSIDVLVGSHKLGEIDHFIEKISDVHLSSYLKESSISNISSFEKITVELDPTDILLFSPYLIHKSNANIGGRVRYSLVTHYIDSTDNMFNPVDYSQVGLLNMKRCINANEYHDELLKQGQLRY